MKQSIVVHVILYSTHCRQTINKRTIDGRSWGDAFETNHPISKERAKEENKSIYDATQFDDDERELAVLVIIAFITYIVENGGWLYMDTNEEALKARGGISMVDFIIGLYKYKVHQWTVEWEFTFGDVILTMDMGDDIIRKIVVHRPPSWQGHIEADLDIHAPSMWNCALSNYFRCSLTGTVKTSHATIDKAIGSEDAILEEKVMGNILMAAHHFLWLAMNAHYALMAASAISKNLLETERNILLPKFHPNMNERGGCVLMSGLSDLFGKEMRGKDKRDHARSIVEQSTLHITAVKSSKDAKLGLDILKVEGGSGLKVTSINANSLFEGSELKVGMVIQSINNRRFASFKLGLALLQEAESAVTIKVFNPLELSDDDLALVKWYKDDLASKKYTDTGKKPVEVGDRVKVTSEGDRVWIVKSIGEDGICELRDESNEKNFVYASIKRVRLIS